MVIERKQYLDELIKKKTTEELKLLQVLEDVVSHICCLSYIRIIY